MGGQRADLLVEHVERHRVAWTGPCGTQTETHVSGRGVRVSVCACLRVRKPCCLATFQCSMRTLCPAPAPLL